MSLTQAPEETAKAVEEAKSISATRLAALKEGRDPSSDAKPKSLESAAVGKPTEKVVESGSANSEPSKTGTPEKASESKATVDWRGVPKAFHSEAEKLSPEFRAWVLRDTTEGDLRWKDYSTKTEDIARQQDVLDFGKAVRDDSEAMALLRDLHDRRTGKSKPKETSEDSFKFTEEHTEEEWQEYFAKRDKRVAENAIATVTSKQTSENRERSERSEIATNVINTLVKGEDKRTLEDVEEAFAYLGDWKGVRALLEAKGEKVTAENVVRALRRVLPPKATASDEKKDPKESTNGKSVSGNGVNGASALGRMNGVTAPITLPKHVLEGREPNSTSERLSIALMKVNEKYARQGKPPITAD